LGSLASSTISPMPPMPPTLLKPQTPSDNIRSNLGFQMNPVSKNKKK
jgi:hypothetical protein